MSLGLVLAIIALILEIVHWAPQEPSWVALVLVTLAVLVSGVVIPLPGWRR